MRQGISLTTLFEAVIGFTLIFAAFLTLTIVYNKAFIIKNEMISIIEKYEGVTGNSLTIINNYLSTNKYYTKGTCEVGEKGSKDLSQAKLENVVNEKEKYYYCISKNKKDNKTYFNVKVFYKFNLPYLENILTFTIKGESKAVNTSGKDQRV